MITLGALEIYNRLLGVRRVLVVGQEFRASMHLLRSLVGWLSLVPQVWLPNQSAVGQILFKEMMRRPGDYVQSEQHEQADGLLN
jgi:hypothetical protein